VGRNRLRTTDMWNSSCTRGFSEAAESRSPLYGLADVMTILTLAQKSYKSDRRNSSACWLTIILQYCKNRLEPLYKT